MLASYISAWERLLLLMYYLSQRFSCRCLFILQKKGEKKSLAFSRNKHRCNRVAKFSLLFISKAGGLITTILNWTRVTPSGPGAGCMTRFQGLSTCRTGTEIIQKCDNKNTTWSVTRSVARVVFANFELCILTFGPGCNTRFLTYKCSVQRIFYSYIISKCTF